MLVLLTLYSSQAVRINLLGMGWQIVAYKGLHDVRFCLSPALFPKTNRELLQRLVLPPELAYRFAFGIRCMAWLYRTLVSEAD